MTESVVFDVLPAANDKKIGIATLNVEKKLNSLTQQMVMLLTDQLIQWEQDETLKTGFKLDYMKLSFALLYL